MQRQLLFLLLINTIMYMRTQSQMKSYFHFARKDEYKYKHESIKFDSWFVLNCSIASIDILYAVCVWRLIACRHLYRHIRSTRGHSIDSISGNLVVNWRECVRAICMCKLQTFICAIACYSDTHLPMCSAIFTVRGEAIYMPHIWEESERCRIFGWLHMIRKLNNNYCS